MKKNQKGFTLIELLITISVIGIMAGILYPSFSKVQAKAKTSSAQSSLHAVQLAIESYQLTNGTYPEGSNIASAALIDTLIESGDLTKKPKNPFTGKEYTASDSSGQFYYTFDTDSNSYNITLYGSNNKTAIYTITNI